MDSPLLLRNLRQPFFAPAQVGGGYPLGAAAAPQLLVPRLLTPRRRGRTRALAEWPLGRRLATSDRHGPKRKGIEGSPLNGPQTARNCKPTLFENGTFHASSNRRPISSRWRSKS